MQYFKILQNNVNMKQLVKEVNSIFSITTEEFRINTSLQIGLQSNKPDKDWNKSRQDGNSKDIHPGWTNPHNDGSKHDAWKASTGRADLMTETDFTYNIFDTPIINHYIEKYNMHRTRLMVSQPRTCLSWHRDRQPRIHIPIQTDIGCRMVIEGEEMHMEKGKIYIADTTKYHSAMNASDRKRIHIVGCVSAF